MIRTGIEEQISGTKQRKETQIKGDLVLEEYRVYFKIWYVDTLSK